MVVVMIKAKHTQEMHGSVSESDAVLVPTTVVIGLEDTAVSERAVLHSTICTGLGHAAFQRTQRTSEDLSLQRHKGRNERTYCLRNSSPSIRSRKARLPHPPNHTHGAYGLGFLPLSLHLFSPTHNSPKTKVKKQCKA